jgi:hypothetical protein
MRWLDTQEFSKFEKCCQGVEGWPSWHWGVLLLYGGHIAVNQVVIIIFIFLKAFLFLISTLILVPSPFGAAPYFMGWTLM